MTNTQPSRSAASGLDIASHTEGDVTTVKVSGELDLHSASTLRDYLADLFAEGLHQMVVDLQAVEFLDTTGLGVLVAGLKKAQSEGGTLDVVCSQSRVLRVFELTGLKEVFTILPEPSDDSRPAESRPEH